MGAASAQLMWGMAADRWGDRVVLSLGLGGAALAMLGAAFAGGSSMATMAR